MSDATLEVEGGQQHPLGIYLKIWILLFVLSTMSYMVDILEFEGYLRWGLIITFMLLKAGFIMSIFMHMFWERMALVTAIIVPPMCLLVLIGLMSFESWHTYDMRDIWMGQDTTQVAKSPQHH